MSEPLADAPTPDEIAGEAQPGGGISPDEAVALKERMEKLETDNANLSKQNAGQSRAYNAEAFARKQAELNAQAMQQMLEQQKAQQQQVQPLAPPNVDFEAMQSDPEALRRGLNDVMQYGAASTLQTTQQMVQASEARSAQRLSGLRGGSVVQALEMGEREWVNRGYDEDTFQSVKSDLRNHLQQSDYNLENALTNEGALSSLAFHLAGQKGLPIEAREAPEPPPSLDVHPPGSDQPSQMTAQEKANWEQIKKTLPGLPADTELDEGEVAEMRRIRAGLDAVSPR